MTVKPGPDRYPADGQEHLAEPRHLKADNPGECPKPKGCVCHWTALSLGWTRGANPKCTADH